jgi:hypothetical protein
MGHKKYTKKEVEEVVKHLLATDPELNNWHSPKGVAAKRARGISIKLTQDEHWAIKFLCKRERMSMDHLVKWMLIGHYIKKEPQVVLECARVAGQRVMRELFGVIAKKSARLMPELKVEAPPKKHKKKVKFSYYPNEIEETG